MTKLYIRHTETMGRGVFAKEKIPQGHIVEECPCIELSAEDDANIQKTVLRFYVFNSTKFTSVIALGYGSLYNHAPDSEANAFYVYDAAHNCIIITAKREIEKDEQILINYGYNPLVEIERWNSINLAKGN